MCWILLLNDMRSGNIENLQPVARAETKELLKALLAKYRVDPYVTVGQHILIHTTDQQAGQVDQTSGYRYSKCYRKDSPLEWYNEPLSSFEDLHFRSVGTAEDWANSARQQWHNQIAVIPMAESI